MCVYRGFAGGAAEMNEPPHPSLLGHHSLTIDDIPRIHPSTQPSPATVSPDLSSRVIKSSGQAHRIRGRTIKVQKLSISWSISEQPLRRSFNCFCWCCPVEYAAEDFALTESQRMADGYKNPQQIWGFGWLHLNWLYLSKMLFMTHS